MENNEEKVTYKGEEMSPQEFVERMEIDTKKKERNAESIARQKLLKKQEELERRKAFASALIPTEEDKIPDNYGPGSDQQEEPTDMSMYQVNMPFDIQQAPVQQFQSLEIPQTQEARLGGLMRIIDDNNINAFKDGGKKTDKDKKSEYEKSFPINTSGPRNENQSTIYSEDIKKEDLPLSASPSYRAYTMAKVGGYDEVTNRMGMGSHDIRENLIIKSDPESGYNYFLNPETGKEFEPLDYEGSKSDNLQRFLINVNRGEGQTKDFYSKTDKNGNLTEGSIPKFINTDEDTKQNIFKDLYIQNLAKYKNKDRAYYKSVNTMQNIVEPQLNSISYTGDDTDKYAFNKDNNRSMSQVKDIYWQKASDEVVKDLVKKYGSVSQARDKVSSEELNKLIENSEYYKNKTKDLEKDYKDYEKNKNLIKNAKFSNGGLFSRLMDDNNISTYKKSKKK